MPRKPLKKLKKKPKFQDWEIDFLKNGPLGDFEDWRRSPYRYHYLDGREIWARMKNEPGVDLNDYPWAMQVYDGGQQAAIR